MNKNFAGHQVRGKGPQLRKEGPRHQKEPKHTGGGEGLALQAGGTPSPVPGSWFGSADVLNCMILTDTDSMILETA